MRTIDSYLLSVYIAGIVDAKKNKITVEVLASKIGTSKNSLYKRSSKVSTHIEEILKLATSRRKEIKNV